MGFIRKILGLSESGDGNTQPRILHQRPPRIQILPLHRVSFKLERPKFAPPDSLKLANVSYGGVGFIRDSSSNWPNPGQVIDGYLSFGEHTFPVKLLIVHVSSKIIGCKNENEDIEELQRALFRYFLIEISAIQMSEVNPKMIQSEPGTITRWFRGDDLCDFYVSRDQDGLARFTLSFFGNYLEWDRGTGMKFGQVVEDEEEEASKPKRSAIIQILQSSEGQLIETAQKFVENVQELPEAERNEIIKILDEERSA